jgi:ATP-dependent DNA helicase RecG
MSIIF